MVELSYKLTFPLTILENHIFAVLVYYKLSISVL